MTKRAKLDIKSFSLIFSVANLVLFLMYFMPYYVAEDYEFSLAYEYFRLYTDEILRWILPVAAASFLAMRCANDGVKKMLSYTLFISLTNLVYTIPFYYLLGIERGGDTPGSLVMSLLVSLGYTAIFFAHTLVLCFVIRRSVIYFTAKELTKKLPPKYMSCPTDEMWRGCISEAQASLPEKLSEGKMLDLSHPTSLAFFFASLFEFTFYFLIEVFNAGSYLINYVGGYRSGEIAYMIFRFVFILSMLFLSLAVSQVVKKHTKSPADDT